MKTDEKELLLKDLSARLPYGVIVNITGFDFDFKDKLTQIYKAGYGCSIQVTNNMPYGIEQVKPYLLPLSRLYNLDRPDFYNTMREVRDKKGNHIEYIWTLQTYEWLNENHYDYRGLIEKGLAIDATNKNIY